MKGGVKMRYEKSDIQQLKDSVSLLDVVQSLGFSVKKKGQNYFIACPLHDDQHPSAFFKPTGNSVRCPVCCESIDKFKLIEIVEGGNFQESIKRLWEMAGRPGWFKAEEDEEISVKKFYLTSSEAELVGIHLPGKLLIPLRYTAEREYLSDEMPASRVYAPEFEGYLLSAEIPLRWQNFMTEPQLKSFVLKKIAIKENESLSEEDKERLSWLKKKCI